MARIKFISIIIILFLSIYTFGQDKQILFKVNNSKFFVGKDYLDLTFANYFKEAVQSGEALDSDLNEWVKAYKIWIDQATTGTYHIEVLGGMKTSLSYEGFITEENLGRNPSGKKDKHSLFSARIKTHYGRMARLNTVLSDAIATLYTSRK